MAKVDWVRFSTSVYPHTTNQGILWVGGTGISTTGGGNVALAFDTRVHGNLAAAGLLYTGPDAASFPLRDGAFSCAIRVSATGSPHYNDTVFGGAIRCQTLVAEGALISSVNSYFVGTNRVQTTGQTTAALCIRRVLAGVRTPLFTTTVHPPVLDSAGRAFIQWEIRAKNNGSNVEFWERHNGSLPLSIPGSSGWTSWTLLGTDTSPGVLTNGGYWGPALLQESDSGSGGSRNYDGNVWDNVMINLAVD